MLICRFFLFNTIRSALVLFLLNADRYFFEGKMRFVLNIKTALILIFLVIFSFISYFMLGLSSYLIILIIGISLLGIMIVNKGIIK